MKAIISAGNTPALVFKCEDECIDYDKEDHCIISANKCYKISRINTGESNAKRFQIETSIEWTDNKGFEKNIELKTTQLVMNKQS